MSFLRRIRTFDSLVLPYYRLVLLGQVGVATGLGMDTVSRSWLVYQLTGSPWQLGLINAARGLPFLLFGLLAGAVADRYGRKTLIALAQSVCALIHLAVAFLVLTNRIELWHLYASAFLTGSMHAFQQPARQVLISDLVGDKLLLNAISLNSVAANISRGIGPAIAGLVIQASGVGYGFLAQGALYAFSVTSILQVKVPPSAGPTTPKVRGAYREARSLFSGIGEGMRYVFSQKLILVLLVLGLAPVVLAAPFVTLMPVFAIEIFHGDARTQGVLLAMLGAGSVLGGLLSASSRHSNGKFMIFAAAALGLSLVFFAYSPFLSMAMFFVFLNGAFDIVYSTQNLTTLQLLAPQDIRGRVLSFRMLDKGFEPLGSVLYGGLAALLSAPSAVAIMGAACFLLALGVGFSLRATRRTALHASGP